MTLLAKTAGMTKQDYIMSKLTDTAITVQPSTRTYKALKDDMAKAYAELARIRRTGDMDADLEQRVILLADILRDLGAEAPAPQLNVEAAAIAGMTRG